MLTAERIHDELARAFSDRHGRDCECCAPFAAGRSPLEVALLAEARCALVRFEADSRPDMPTEAEVDVLAELAVRDALDAAREAITARAVARLAVVRRDRPEPVLVPIDPATHRISCRAEAFDGTYYRQCTRPAPFTRDGLEVCRLHARLDRIRSYTEGTDAG